MIEKPCIANITRIYRKHESPIHFNKKILSIYNINKKNRVKEKIERKSVSLHVCIEENTRT